MVGFSALKARRVGEAKLLAERSGFEPEKGF